jgi:hypothetical protein
VQTAYEYGNHVLIYSRTDPRVGPIDPVLRHMKLFTPKSGSSRASNNGYNLPAVKGLRGNPPCVYGCTAGHVSWEARATADPAQVGVGTGAATARSNGSDVEWTAADFNERKLLVQGYFPLLFSHRPVDGMQKVRGSNPLSCTGFPDLCSSGKNQAKDLSVLGFFGRRHTGRCHRRLCS